MLAIAVMLFAAVAPAQEPQVAVEDLESQETVFSDVVYEDAECPEAVFEDESNISEEAVAFDEE